jgi:hypothetical protein
LKNDLVAYDPMQIFTPSRFLEVHHDQVF